MTPPRSSDRALLAPGASTHTAYAPGPRASLPPVDERIVMPESRAEILNGELRWSMPADAPHATKHLDLAYVLAAHVAPGYRGAVDMLTRTSATSDFAPDASVFRPREDGERDLEELALEVTDKQRLAVPTDKARELARRGVRRIFAILVKHARVLEWSATRDDWQILALGSTIKDRCFTQPLPVKALLSAAAGDEAVANALLGKKIPVLEAALAARQRQGREEGALEAARTSVLLTFEARGWAVSAAVRKRIATCTDAQQLQTWLRAAVTAPSVAASLQKLKGIALRFSIHPEAARWLLPLDPHRDSPAHRKTPRLVPPRTTTASVFRPPRGLDQAPATMAR